MARVPTAGAGFDARVAGCFCGRDATVMLGSAGAVTDAAEAGADVWVASPDAAGVAWGWFRGWADAGAGADGRVGAVAGADATGVAVGRPPMPNPDSVSSAWRLACPTFLPASCWPIWTAIWPSMRAAAIWLRPRWARSGTTSRRLRTRPRGAYTRRSSAWSRGFFGSLTSGILPRYPNSAH